MPSGKDRSKEDTWKESDLKKALKDDKKKARDSDRKSKERSSHRDEDRRERRDRDDDRRRRGHDEVANGENDHKRSDKDKEREHRKRDGERDRERTRDKGRDRDRDREREHEKDKERERRRERDGEGSKETDRSRETRDRDKSKERRRERERDDRERHHDREGRREKERDIEREAEKRSKEKRGRDRDREGERHREHGKGDRSRDRRKEREQEDKERGKDKAKERDIDRERERGKAKERDRADKENKDSEREDRRRRRERHEKEYQESDKDAKRREHHRSRNEDGSKDGRHKKREDRRERTRDDKDRGKERPEGVERKEKDAKSDKVRRREQEMMDSLKKEEESKKKDAPKFRSDTLEEADQIDEDIEQRRKGSLHRDPSVAGAEEINDEEAAGYDYEEDFEDYEEDFEDDGDEGEDDDQETSVNLVDHAGMQELLLAINAENQDARLSSREGSKELIERTKGEQNNTAESTKVTSTTTSASRGRINFVAARQKQITDNVASRTRRRGQELMHLIDLDVAAFDIFDLPPLNEYELYIKNFGRSDTKQAYVQCNEDNLEKEAQTEEIETRTKWTQNPATDAAGVGDEEDDSLDDLSTLTEKANIDSLRLSKFLQRAAQTCLILLEESVTERTSTQFKDRGDMTCSDGFIQLSTKHFYIEGRFVKCIHLSPVQSHLLLIAYGPVTDSTKVTAKTDTSVLEKGVVCLWNTNEPSEPSKVLICESVPRCCCLSPSKATLAFAGLEDGSLVAWDLREPSSLHYSSKVTDGNSEIVMRLPTFSTAGILKKDESHLSPVVSVLPVVMPGDSARASGGTSLVSDDMLGLSFQLASLEENATISIWVVVELDRADTAGSESDLGLLPGGKIKLIKSSSISLHSPFRDFRKNLSLQALIMRFLPQDPNHIYVGTDGGYVAHCVRHGGRAPPKCHRPEMESVVEISAIDASPWQLPCILAGGKDGTVWLFNLKNETPLSTWSSATDGSAVVSLQWSRSKPSVFYVLDANSCLHVWDLLKSIQGPVAVEKFKHGRVVSFDLSSDYSASGIGIPGRSPELVLAYESGAVEVHKLSSPFSKASGDELDRFASYLDGLL